MITCDYDFANSGGGRIQDLLKLCHLLEIGWLSVIFGPLVGYSNLSMDIRGFRPPKSMLLLQ